MARATSPPGPPPTLAYLAEQAAGIDAECRDCRHRVVLGFEKFLARYGDVPFPRLHPADEMLGLRPDLAIALIEKPRR